MNRIMSRAGLLLLATTLSLSAFAKPRSENVTLYHDATLNGTTIPAGEYVVKYEVDGSTANVKFVKGNKEVASASGQVKTLNRKVDANQVVLNNGGAVPSISEIDFGGKTSAISFDSMSANAGK